MPCHPIRRATRLCATVTALLVCASSASLAQVGQSERLHAEEEQRCVWRCLADSPGAASRQYQDCVARMCMAPPAGQARPSQPARRAGGWTSHSAAGGRAHSAEIAAGNLRLSLLCSRGGPVLVGVAGFGGRADTITLSIDGRAHRGSAVTRNGIHYAEATPAMIRGLVGGRQVQVTAGSSRTTFGLSGSGAAIGAALSGCGVTLR